MVSGVLPTGKFEGRQQLRDKPAMVAVFADHAPPPKLEGITEAIDLDEGDTEYEDATSGVGVAVWESVGMRARSRRTSAIEAGERGESVVSVAGGVVGVDR